MTAAIRYSFTLHERLKREQDIKTLFHTGEAFSSFPLKCIWLQLPRNNEKSPVRIAIAVPKKRIRQAVGRNRIKRLIREAWRLHKHELYTAVAAGRQLHLFFIFTGQADAGYAAMAKSIRSVIGTLSGKINKQPDA